MSRQHKTPKTRTYSPASAYQPTQTEGQRTPSRRLALLKTALFTTLLTLLLTTGASAGTYTIDDCPSAPAASSNAGDWTIFGSPQADQATCSGGPGAFIGPLGASMAPNTSAGVTITAPAGSGITIPHATVWWAVPQASGATNFALAGTNAGAVQQAQAPLDDTFTPDQFTLPSTTTSLALSDYCSSDDGATGCSYGAGEDPILELLGAQLTLEDTSLPSGSVTGGALATSATLRATQALAYSVNDTSSGVRLVKLLVDGLQVAENDYLDRCPYENFLACPANISDTIAWNTATVADGQHSIEAIVENTAQNTTVFYTATITTHNAPSNTTAPSITPSQATIGSPLTASPGGWSAPTGAGPLTYNYQWEDCNQAGNDCQAIPGAQTPSYTPQASDAGHTLRALITAADEDGISSTATTPTSAIPVPAGTPQSPNNTATPSAGAPNGTPASETATLKLTSPTTLARSYKQSALKLTGRLTTNQTQPISGATLDILQQPENTNTTTLIAHTTTSATGTFTANIPRGPSRTITIAYRANTNNTTYTTTTQSKETIAASIHLTIKWQTAPGPTGTIELTGKVQGPIPPQGTIIELLVYYRGKWEPFRTPRTNTNGHFHQIYSFQNALGHFPFRAQTPTGQTNFPYTHGNSNTITINTAT